MDYILIVTVLVHNFPFHQLFLASAEGNCGGRDRIVCCSGYMLNETTGKCIKCELGFFDVNCSRKCQAPSFGELCQNTCDCPDEICDFAFGCTNYKKCRVGYVGIRCQHVCKYPTFGEDCQKICNCSQSDCNPSSGCHLTTVPIITFLNTTSTASTSKEQVNNQNFIPTPVLIGIFVMSSILSLLCAVSIAINIYKIFPHKRKKQMKISQEKYSHTSHDYLEIHENCQPAEDVGFGKEEGNVIYSGWSNVVIISHELKKKCLIELNKDQQPCGHNSDMLGIKHNVSHSSVQENQNSGIEDESLEDYVTPVCRHTPKKDKQSETSHVEDKTKGNTDTYLTVI